MADAMRQILVIGSVNHDCIWQLESPVVSGRRLRVREKSLVLGGGGFYTGKALLDLEAEVVLVSRLRRDELGLAALDTLNDIGFQTQHVELVDGDTKPIDILIDPNGERTILAPRRVGDPPIRAAAATPSAAAAYINALHLDPALLDALSQTPLVVSQLPLNQATARPADYVVSSLDDIGRDIQDAWRRAVDVAGPRLKSLIVTNGPDPIAVHDGVSSRHIAASGVSGVCNSLGAGDHFAGVLLHALLDGQQLDQAVHAAAVETAKWLERRRAGNSA